jgi:hypothetical protein
MLIAVRVFELFDPKLTDEQIAAKLGVNVKAEDGIFTLNGVRVGFRERKETLVLLASRPALQSMARNFAVSQGESEKAFPGEPK